MLQFVNPALMTVTPVELHFYFLTTKLIIINKIVKTFNKHCKTRYNEIGNIESP